MTAAPVPDVTCQQALERVLIYLRDDGLTPTAETCRQALHLVESAMAEGAGADLPARCIDRIPDYFERPGQSIPDAQPPLERGHIGYD